MNERDPGKNHAPAKGTAIVKLSGLKTFRGNGLERILILIWLLLLGGCLMEGDRPTAVDGVIDLEGWDFETKGGLRLDGEWEVYEGRLDPSDFSAVELHDAAGGAGKAENGSPPALNGKKDPGNGWVTVRLTVKIAPSKGLKALGIEEDFPARAIYANGDLLYADGVPVKPREIISFPYPLNIFPLMTKNRIIELIVQFPNGIHPAGGAWNSLHLGNENQIRRDRNLRWMFDLFLSGALLIMGLYHLGLYLIRRNDPAPLYLAFICFSWATKTMVAGEGGRFVAGLFSEYSRDAMHTMDLISLYLTASFILVFISSLYPKEAFKKVTRASMGLGIVFCASALIAPVGIAAQALRVFETLGVPAMIYLAYVLSRAAFRKRVGAPLVVAGFVVFSLMVANDVLYDSRIVQTMYLTPVGVIVLIIFLSLALFLRLFKPLASGDGSWDSSGGTPFLSYGMCMVAAPCRLESHDHSRATLVEVILIPEVVSHGDGGKPIRGSGSNPDRIAWRGTRPPGAGWRMQTISKHPANVSPKGVSMKPGFTPFPGTCVASRATIGKSRPAWKGSLSKTTLSTDARPRVLVVDDDPDCFQKASEYLSPLDISVRGASNGKKALKKIYNGNPPDLVLLGAMAEGMEGRRICGGLRQKFSLSELPVVMLIPRGRTRDLVEGFEAGANDYISTPLTKIELIARVRLQLTLKERFKTPKERAHPKDVKRISVPVERFIEELNRNRNRIQSIEGFLRIKSGSHEGEDNYLDELRRIDKALERMCELLANNDGPATVKRHLIVEVMDLAVNYWVDSTRSTKVDLAHKSKLWKVYTNKDGWQRTQTMDKYLNVDTLPGRPRWKQVAETADFVLSRCDGHSFLRDRLNACLARLRVCH